MRVLLIEDNPDILKVASLALRLDGRFQVLQASSGRQGLAMARVEHPDLVVLDVVMPEMDGYETLRRLKADAETAAIPVIFLTINGTSAEQEQSLALGALGLVPKPFDPLQLPGQLLALANPSH